MKVDKVKITAKPIQLKARWAVSLEPDDDISWSTGIEDQVAKWMQKKIDWEILSTLLIEQGWTSVTLSKGSTLETLAWVQKNLKGKYHTDEYRDWIFEKHEDATWFTVRWS